MPKADLAQQLLDAQVQFTLKRLTGDELQQSIQDNVDQLLAVAEKLKLSEVVKPAQVKQVALRYASDLQLDAGIPELIGLIARKLYDHKIHERTTLEELLPDRMFAQYLDKALEMEPLRERLIAETISNPIYSALISDVLYNGIKGYLANSKLAERIPGARSALKLGRAMASKARPDLESNLDEGLRNYVRKSTKANLQSSEAFLNKMFSSDQIREVILDIWAEHKHHTVAEARDFVGKLDLEEIIVLGYEHWQHLRQTPLYKTLIEAGIEQFFKRYGKHTLSNLLDDIGIERQMLLDDAMLFLPPALQALQAKKLLEPVVRANLAPFYESPEVGKLLAG